MKESEKSRLLACLTGWREMLTDTVSMQGEESLGGKIKCGTILRFLSLLALNSQDDNDLLDTVVL